MNINSHIKKQFMIFLAAAALVPAVCLAAGGRGSVAINSGVDKNRITIGDRIRYSVKITRDKNLIVELPGLAANLGQFEIRDYAVHETKEYDSFSVDSIDYIITTFDTGNYVIPPISATITLPDSSSDTLFTDPIPIRVESVMKGEAKDIRDIKPPLAIERDWSGYIRYGGLGAALLLLSAAGYLYYRKRRGEKPFIAGRREIRPAHETALSALEELAASTLLEDGEIKEYHIRISDILRRYAEERYYIPAPEMVTEETIEALRNAGIPEDVLTITSDFLTDCDMVKFAKVIPSEESIIRTTEAAFDIVNRTKWIAPERYGAEEEGKPAPAEPAPEGVADAGEGAEDISKTEER